jgi:restriction endonuclease S subunit
MSEKTGSRMPRANVEHLLTLEIPLPPLPEQRRIATILAEQLAAVERARAAAQAQLQAAQTLPAAYLCQVFPQPNQALPPDWRWARLDEIKSGGKRAIVSGPFGSNIGKRFFVESGVPLIRGCNLTKGEKLFVEEGFVFITEEKADELRSCTALPGDLIFTAAGTIGQVGLIPNNCRYPKYVISNKQLRARVDLSRASPEFLFRWFSTPMVQRILSETKTGSSIPLITLGILRSVPIPLPPLTDQQRIAATLTAQLAAAERLRQTLQAQLDAINALPAALLRRAFNGEL